MGFFSGPRSFVLGALAVLPCFAPSLRAAPLAKTKTAAADPRVFAIRPLSGPATGGTAASVYGLDFAASSTISIGGIAATGVSLADPTRLDAKTPALPPGSVSDVVVTIPGSSPVILPAAWFAQFLDVPPSHLFARPIEKLRRAGITTGCGGGNYCPGDPVTRAQMAVFILRGEHGSGYHPPPATGTVFDDVPKSVLFADWMEQFAAEGITTGCGGKNYCPDNSVTRGEMAVFLLRARFGKSHNPPPPTGAFTDVTTTTPFAKWIEELAGRGITTGCGGGGYCPTLPSTRGQMAVFLTKTFGTSPSELIADDLAHDDIDYETSLLYRFYALFSDQRLPARYRNAPSDGEDSGLFQEVEAVLPSLSAAGQAAIAPFLARPDDPASPFGPAASTATTTRRPDAGSQNECPTSWIESSGSHFKAHLCSSGNAAADGTLLSGMLAIAEPLWSPMTAGMGEPIADCFMEGGSEVCLGGDGKIDIYILATNECWESPPPVAGCWSIEANALAEAVGARPNDHKSGSGFILLDRKRAADAAKIRTDFAHEFFHILQFRHNAKAMSADTGVEIHGETIWDRSWFVEASATWAEWRFVPATSPAEVHFRFSRDFQPNRYSLLTDSPKRHMYASYIWPFFVEQEKGASSIFQAWVAAEAANNPADITSAVEQQLSFQTHFRDFAVRNWNENLPGDPIAVLYEDLEASDGTFPPFPQTKPPLATSFRLPLTGGTPSKVASVNVSLAAQYDEITFEPDVRKVILKFDKLPGSMDVDLLVEIDGGDWKREQVSKDVPVVYCREKEDENVSRIIVITSNHEKKRHAYLSGDYEIEGRPSCCSELKGVTAWKGRVSTSYSFGGTQVEGTITRDYTISDSFEISADLQEVLKGEFRAASFTGSGSEHDEVASHDESQVFFPNTQDGGGPLTEESGLGLSIDLQNCTFTFAAKGSIEVVNNFDPNFPETFHDLVGIARGTGTHSLSDFTDKLSGSATVPAHSLDWQFTNPDSDGYIVGGLGANWFFVSPEDSGGSAQISWEFTPDPPVAAQTAKPDRPR
ncbi:MAG TPA: S-layer homology domain-containing protein [Thermoanaerobaculia bacterium]